jgi:hypothetical protein
MFKSFFKVFISRKILDQSTKKIIKHNLRQWSSSKVNNKKSTILIDFYTIPETVLSFSYFANVLAKKNNSEIISFSDEPKIINSVLHKVYESFNTSSHIFPKLNLEQESQANTIFESIKSKIKTKDGLFNLEIMGLDVGVDIYETYLRTYLKPTVDLNDPKLIYIVKKAILLIIFWVEYFKKEKVAAVIVSHDMYIQYNLICKVAYSFDIPVYLPNILGATYAKKPYSCYTYFREYRKEFNKLSEPEKEQGVFLAKKQINKKMNGEVGVDMPYSTKTAFHKNYAESRALKESSNVKVLIASNCFYDNPHGYEKMLFRDYYEWLFFLGGISQKTNYDWYLKMHPDPMPGTVEDMEKILSNFPNIKFLSNETSHFQLIEEGIDVVLTTMGSVGHEYPLFGIPVVNAGYNPHIAYDFNMHPVSIDSYKETLLKLDNLNLNINTDDIYEFYFMHYINSAKDDFILNSNDDLFSKLDVENRTISKFYDYFLNQFSGKKHIDTLEKINNFIDSKETFFFKF